MKTLETIKPYLFQEHKNGFSIKHPTKDVEINVCLNDTKNKIEVYTLNQKCQPQFFLLQFRSLLTNIAGNFYNDWKFPSLDSKGKNGYYANLQVQKWAINRTAHSLNHRVLQCWKNLLQKADQLVLQIEKRLFSVFGPKEYFRRIYLIDNINEKDRKYYISDLLKYRAATYLLTDFIDLRLERRSGTIYYLHLDLMKQGKWMECIASPGESLGCLNSNLRKTLMNIPGNVPIWLLKRFNLIGINPLQRTITNRLELISFLAGISHHNFFELHRQVLEFATEKQLRKAIAVYDRQTHCKTNLRKFFDIQNAINWILDYNQPHNCKSVVALAERSKVWHRENMCKKNQAILGKKTVLPSIPLPTSNCIEFLSTSDRILEEGQLMNHCVTSYINKALRGDCYLFHINYKNRVATAELNKEGYVVQIKGPKNQTNKACDYGKRILSQWGKGFRKENCKTNP